MCSTKTLKGIVRHMITHAPIAEAYAENGGTPHLDRRHTVFGQLVDEDSYKVLDEIANIEVGAQDKPLEDVVIETVEVAD